MTEFSPARRYFPAEFATAYRAAGYWTDQTFATFLSDAADSFGDLEAVVGKSVLGEQERLSYRELDTAAAAVAGRLRDLGVTAGDRVLIQLPNTSDYLRVVFGVFRLGAVPVFSLPAHRNSEISHFLRLSGARVYVTVGSHAGFDHRQLAREVTAGLTHPPVVLIIDPDPQEFEPLHDSGAPPPAAAPPASVHPESLAFLQISGGTTGVPKLIPRTHTDYLYSVRESALICGLDTSTRMLVVLPAAHNFTMSSPGILGVLYAGGTVVMAGDPSPTTAFTAIQEEQITLTSVVPPLAMTWLASRPMIDRDISSLRLLQVGGAKFPPEAARRITPELGCHLQQVFGMAEGLVNYTRAEDSAEITTGTQGRPISPADEIRVVDDEDNPVAEGQRGHLLTRGPYTIRGYLGGVDADSFDAEGFYRTGDIVRRLPSGHLVVEGRDKDQINRGGEKISAEEVENHLIAHPGVIDAALVAVPDAFLGERSCAFVLAAPPPPTEQLLAFLRERGLSAHKIPDDVEFAAEFPVTGVGKISRKQLRRQLAEHLTTQRVG